MTELHVSDRAWLTYDPTWRYRFGPINSPELVILGVDEYGVQWWSDEPEGWAAPTAATVIDERPYGDGGYDGDTYFGPRPLSFGSGSDTGLAVAPDRPAALRAWRRLLAVATSRQPVLYTGPDEDDDGVVGDWSLWLRATGQPKMRWVSDHAFEWSFVMVAVDPLKHDAAEEAQPHEAGLPIPPTGALWPLTFPVTWGIGGTDTAMVITNRGDEPAQARYRINGPADHPQIINDTTGAYARIERVLQAGDVAEVDTRSATVRLNGTNIFLDLSGGFPLIQPGDNTIRWSHRGPHNPDALLTVTTASTRK